MTTKLKTTWAENDTGHVTEHNQISTRLKNVYEYGASGLYAQTTGSVSAGSSSLVVADGSSFAVGQGIFIKGAGASGTDFVTTISVINGSTLTLAANASTDVSSVLAQHDDTAAINAALAAAYNAGGGVVYLPKTGSDGYYRCNGAYNARTNSILTIPARNVFPGWYCTLGCINVILEGETRGYYKYDFSVWGGCIIDCSDAPHGGGTRPAFYAPEPYVLCTNNQLHLSYVHASVKELSILLPSDPSMDGLMFSNIGEADIERVSIISKPVSIYNWYEAAEPTHGTVGVYLPQRLNNTRVYVGPGCFIDGFDTGVVFSEHTIFMSPYITHCKTGLFAGSSDRPGWGCVELEQCATALRFGTAAAYVNLNLNLEMWETAGRYYTKTSENDIVDASNVGRGIIAYLNHSVPSETKPAASVTGCTNLVLTNLYGA